MLYTIYIIYSIQHVYYILYIYSIQHVYYIYNICVCMCIYIQFIKLINECIMNLSGVI